MAASTAIATIAMVQSSIALQQAEQAKTEACKGTVATFNAQGATVEQMKSYASCVQRLHPEPVTQEGIWVAKGAIVLVFLGIIAGIIFTYRDSNEYGSNGVVDYFLYALLGGLILPAVAAILIFLGYGAYYLFAG